MALCHPSQILLLLYLLLLPFFLGSTVLAGSYVDSLPGYDGNLNFKLETGYIGVDKNEEVQLFYYFFESQRNPSVDPLMLWIPGGPACSALAAIFFENGPLALDIDNYNGGLPKLIENEDAWTKTMNIIYLDAPFGTGFSYATAGRYSMNDTTFVAHTFEFIQKWLMEHENFRKNQLYLAGEGYSGNIIPVVIQNISDANANQKEQIINIKGYVMGNPGTDKTIDFNSRVVAAHNLALIPKDIYETASASCNDKFFPAPSDHSTPCAQAIKTINKLLCNVDPTHILNAACLTFCSQLIPMGQIDAQCSNIPLPYASTKKCKDNIHGATEAWANDATVQEALHVRENKVPTWMSCNGSKYKHGDNASVFIYHQNFTHEDLPLRGLIYSGDHDLSITYVGTLKWINLLNLPVVDEWRPWCVDNETAGYTRKFQSGKFSMRFATIKGSGHFAAQLKPQAWALVKSWMDEDFPLIHRI